MIFKSRPFASLVVLAAALLAPTLPPSLSHATESLPQFGLPTQMGFLDPDGAAGATQKKGDVYILWGDLSRRWTKQEYGKIYEVVTWLSSQGYRAIVNPVAYEADIRDAVAHSGVAGIIWSSHGSDDGAVYDSADHTVERDAFARGARKSFRHLVMGNCYGTVSTQYYRLPKGVTPHVWEGESTTAGFFRYLNSEKWRQDFVRDLKH